MTRFAQVLVIPLVYLIAKCQNLQTAQGQKGGLCHVRMTLTDQGGLPKVTYLHSEAPTLPNQSTDVRSQLQVNTPASNLATSSLE